MDWDDVLARLIAGEAPARNEAAAIMAIDSTKAATPYFTLRAFNDMFGKGVSGRRLILQF